jgi:hypothetical protein
VYPDIELLLTSYLATKTGERAVTELPAELDSILPVIRVTRISGADEDFHLDYPVVDVDVFATDRAGAQQLSDQIRHALRWDLPTVDCVQDAGVVTSVRTINAPRWLPDSNTNLRRYNASYQVTAHA